MSKKKRRIRQRRLIKRLIIMWGILGIVGLAGILYALGNWFLGLFAAQKGSGNGTGDKNYGWFQGSVEDVVSQENGLGEVIMRGEAIRESESGFLYVVPEDIVNGETCRELYEANQKLLVLVNREHALEEGAYEDTLHNICNGRLQASDYLYDDLVDLLAAAGEEGYQYWIASAYRSRERQQELIDEDVACYMAQGLSKQQALEKTYEQTMPAGKSEHETGLALDILCSENLNMDVTQAQEPGNRWLAEHAWEYGFILRYPADKEEVTGILYEPWHFRYVGKEAASFLWKYELTLEEFWEILEEGRKE